jgi:urea transport system permease protein
LPEAWLYLLGALFIVVTLFLPKGVVGLLERWRLRAPVNKEAAPA